MGSFARNEKIVWDAFEDEAVLVHPETGQVWVLNPTGAFVWAHCNGKLTLDTISAKLASQGLDPNQVRDEARAFCNEMSSQGLLVAAPGDPATSTASSQIKTAAPAKTPAKTPAKFQAPYVPPLIQGAKPGPGGAPNRPSPRRISGPAGP